MARERYKWFLSEGIKSRLSDTSFGCQRAIFEDGQLLLVLHEPPRVSDRERVVSVFLRDTDGSWQHNGQHRGEAMLHRLLEDYATQFDVFERQYEKAGSAAALFRVMEALNPLLRAIRNLDMAVESALIHVPEDRLLLEARDKAIDLYRNYELLVDETRLALDFRIAQNAETQNQKAQQLANSQHKLNMMAAITFPMMAMSSLFGMNLLSGFETTTSGTFWMMAAIGIGLGVYSLKWIKRKDAAEFPWRTPLQPYGSDQID